MTRKNVDPADRGPAAGTEVSWAPLAEQAAAEVNARYGHRLLGLPGTWIGSLTQGPHPLRLPRRPWPEWHYWWQAHYLDAVVDSGFAHLRSGSRLAARAELQRGQALLRGILLRNAGRFPNYFFDDMAWLALAAGRLNQLSLRTVAKPARLAVRANTTLTGQLHSAHDDVLGGGIYWSRKRDFKNTPANGPAALHLARIGETGHARALMDWLRAELFDPATGLYLDGVHPTSAGRSVETTIYSYNQGTVLGVLLELGSPEDLRQAAALVDAVARHLGDTAGGVRLQPGGGDGSLFTGILCRYLALAARDARLPADTRRTTSGLVTGTAQQVKGQPPRQLSDAVQRWSILAAAASL